MKRFEQSNEWILRYIRTYILPLPFAEYVIKLRNLTNGEVCDFSAFLFSLKLMFDQTISNIIVCVAISHNDTTHKGFTNELSCCSEY